MKATQSLKLSATSALVLLLVGSVTASAGLVGSTASFESVYQLTATDDVIEILVATIVVSDTEVEIPQVQDILPPAPSSSVDIGDGFFEQQFFEDGGFDVVHQNLAVLTFDQDPPLIITSASLAASNTLDIMPSAISFSGNQLFLDVSSGPMYAPNDVLRIDIATMTVPEASSITLLGLAIFSIMVRHRRERRMLLR